MSASLVLCYLFLLHFIADFILQSREMGKKKSEDPYILFQHVGIQFGIFFIFGGFVLGWEAAFLFALLNAAVHGAIDWNIWNLYKWSVFHRNKDIFDDELGTKDISKQVEEFKQNWKYYEDHWFYTTIGFDQLLHICTIILLWGWLLI